MKGRLLLSSTIYFGRWVWVESKVVAGCHIYYLCRFYSSYMYVRKFVLQIVLPLTDIKGKC